MVPSDSATEERELIRRAQKGDGAAFERLVLDHQDRVHNTILRIVGDFSVAADLTQEVFIKAWKHLAEFDDRARFSTWLHRVAQNEVVSHWRHENAAKRGGGKRLSLDAEHAVDPSSDARRPNAAAPTPLQAMEMEEREAAIMGAIQSLDPESRDVVVLREVEGLSYEEIAGRLGINAGTVRSRLFRARERLREKLVRNMDD